MQKLSKFFRLNLRDFAKGLLMAMLGAISGLIIPLFEAGDWHFDWTLIWKTALSAGGLYLVKNLLTNSKDEVLTPEIKKP